MAYKVKRVDYYTAQVPDKPGIGLKMLEALKKDNVNLLAFSGFPSTEGHAQLDFVPENAKAFLAAAQKVKLDVEGPKGAFMISGDDRVGVGSALLKKLADARINITALQGTSAGKGRFGAIMWVKQANVAKAAKILGA